MRRHILSGDQRGGRSRDVTASLVWLVALLERRYCTGKWGRLVNDIETMLRPAGMVQTQALQPEEKADYSLNWEKRSHMLSGDQRDGRSRDIAVVSVSASMTALH